MHTGILTYLNTLGLQVVQISETILAKQINFYLMHSKISMIFGGSEK